MIKEHNGYLYKDREISWMLFNERVLQEAESEDTPVLERLKFLAIFSSNNDEFFRVRVASLIRNKKLQIKYDIQYPPEKVLKEIQELAIKQNNRFDSVYQQVIQKLKENRIYILDENELSLSQKITVMEYARRKVVPHLFPIVLDNLKRIPHLRDRSIYLAVRMRDSNKLIPDKHALIEIPKLPLPRFFELPTEDENTYILYIDDVIRTSLKRIFSIFNHDQFEAYTIKVTRDAELTMDEDQKINSSFMEKIQKSIKQRSKGSPTRFSYDSAMPPEMLELLTKQLNIGRTNRIPGGRYHNLKNLMDFPVINNPSLYYEPFQPIAIKEFENSKTIFDAISAKDFLLTPPYQSFDYLIRMLRESAIDPNVKSIKITLYRVAQYSNVVNALINAVKNGKKVSVLMELQARFDEEHNIYWANKLQEAGAKVHFGIPDQKVHVKVCLIQRKENKEDALYAHFSTGNYNGVTSRIYSDCAIFTKDKRYTNDISILMDMLFNKPNKNAIENLWVAPNTMFTQLAAAIENEIKNARDGKPAYIIAKLNSLLDEKTINKLYDASKAGVKIDLIVRGICALVPGVKGLSENIQIISIIDRFLEHTRVFIFGNNGDEKMYLSSADWMSRNLFNRVECAFPIFDTTIKETISEMLNIQLRDNVKARLIDKDFENNFIKNENSKVRSQYAFYDYLKQKHSVTE
ncbi:MAG: polyphosphate kinase 1 [Bacteroidia bacterium]|nr:polyphosphate kinase 1 [Bacteroidia bacterium]